MSAGIRTTYRRADGIQCDAYSIDDDQEYAGAPQTPGPALDTDTPEVSLLLAVLERAILDLGGRGNENGTARASTVANALEAFEWVAADEDDLWSFIWVCDHLLLSVSRTRQRMFVLATRLRHSHHTTTATVKTKGEWRAREHRSPP